MRATEVDWLRPRRLLVFLDACSACVSLVLFSSLEAVHGPFREAVRIGVAAAVCLVMALTLLLVARHGQYSHPRRMSPITDLYGLFKAMILSTAFVSLVWFLTKGFFTGFMTPSRLVLGGSLGAFFVLTVISRLALAAHQRWGFIHGRGLHSVLILGTGRTADEFARFLESRPWTGISSAGRLAYSSEQPAAGGESARTGVICITNTLQGLEDLGRALSASGAEEVIVALDEEEESLLPRVGRLLRLAQVPFRVVPSLFEQAYLSLQPMGLAELPLVDLQVDPADRLARIVKRWVDVLVSIVALVLSAPFMLGATVGVFLDSGRPILYRQQRVGKNGKIFSLLKFRTMVKDADDRLPELLTLNEADGPHFNMKVDPRVTKIGAFLRNWSLDELPQFMNVIGGNMSIVGPRPPTIKEVDRYERDHLSRLRTTPGITGLWQVSGRKDLEFDDMVRLDRWYVDNWSLTLDVRIIFKTFYVILSRKGAR